jgi:dienelactone hydrolase
VAAALGAVLFAAASRAAAAYPSGDSEAIAVAGDTAIELFVYKPAGVRVQGLIVSLHGLGRNAAGYRDYGRKLADRSGALLIVPLFDRERFPTWRYQRAGIARRDAESGALTIEPAAQWTGEILRAIVDRVRAEEDAPDMPYVLMGHSAGAQFLLRAAALAPLDAARIVIANPSSWILPTTDERFPYGFGGLPAALAGERALERYLAQPVTVLLGTADTGAKDLSMTAGARRQGEHRLARGRNAFGLAARTAQAHGWAFGWRLIEVPGVGHSAGRMYGAAEAERALCPEDASAAAAGQASKWPCKR